jgi:23S rRNA pseudouridine2605 synthase
VQLSIVLHEGMHHVVRRIMDASSIPVRRLTRIRIGPLSVAGIPRGSYRELTEGELGSLREAVHLSRTESDTARTG